MVAKAAVPLPAAVPAGVTVVSVELMHPIRVPARIQKWK